MDEPLGALDKNLREEMQEELRQFHRNVGATILYVTHDQQEAASMADRIAIMNHGVAEQVGPPHEVYERPAQQFRRALPRARRTCSACWASRKPALGVCAARWRAGWHCFVVGPRLACGLHRPENIAIGTTPPARENCFPGRITDAVHVAGSVRYRVAITPGCSVVVRTAAGRRIAPPAIDDAVHVGWDAEDMLVLSE